LFSARFLRLGKELCVISSINDITDRKRAEAEKTKLEEQLRQSEKLEAIGQLAGGVAHDFNNLLGSIMGLAEVMRMRPGTSGENLQCIEKIVRIINQASNLIGQLLTFARKTEFDRTVVNVHQSIRNVMDLLRHSVDKRIAITGSLGASSAVILGDACQIENALLNIGINARDAMPRGGTLSFSTETVRMRSGEPPCDKLMLAPGKYVKISMSDTGTGMTPDVRERIFEPFFTTKEPGKGTGLGLSSVYGCMKRHGGAIAVESSPGEGTTFSLYLPAGLAVNGAGPPPEEVLVRGSGFVLIVDDEATICEILTEIVASLGYGSFLCSDPMEAMTYFRDHHTEIDAVLLDLVMPGMSGSECFEKMKEIDPAVAVVIVSGCGDERELKKLKDGGVSTIVSKPFTAGKISKSLYEAIASPG
jgi:signal transduction histidine kinase/CheY-like chemotaxis protein